MDIHPTDRKIPKDIMPSGKKAVPGPVVPTDALPKLRGKCVKINGVKAEH